MSLVLATFFTDSVRNDFRSQQEGREIYDDVECIRIVVAGSREEVARIATDEDRRRFPREYQAYKASAGDVTEIGTPLAAWPPASPSMVRELAYNNIKTVEQLAELPDNIIDVLGMGYRDKREQARAWLAQANGDSAKVAKIVGENEDLKARLAQLEDQIKRFMASEAGVAAPAPRRGPGRPPKNAPPVVPAASDPEDDNVAA